jgi:arylsulfatase A-like enzyme
MDSIDRPDPVVNTDVERHPAAVEASPSWTFWHCGVAHALVWAFFFAASALLGYFLPDTVWNYRLIPPSLRAGLVSFGGVALLPLTLVVSVLLAVPFVMRRRGSSEDGRSWWGATVRLACATIVLLIVFLYGASWASFFSTGQFLGMAAIGLWLTNPVQLLQHVADIEPRLLLIVPLGASIVLALLLLLGKLAFSLPWRLCRAATLLSIVPLLLCFRSSSYAASAVAALDIEVWDPESGAQRQFRDFYSMARADRTGPMASVFASLGVRRERESQIPKVPITVPVDSTAIIPIGQYDAGVDPTRVHNWNVIVLVVESLRSDELLAYGGHRLVMPNVERIAKESRVYTNNVTTATHSNYASVVPLSGQYPLRSAFQIAYPKKPAYPRVLIYDILKSRDYHTAVFSSQNEYWGGMYYYLNTGSIDRFFHSETYDGPTYSPETDIGFARWSDGGKRAGKIDDRITVNAAVQWLDSLHGGHAGTQPFFMYVNLQSSHVPYQRPSDFPPRFGSGKTSFTIGFNRFPLDSASAVHDIYDNSLAYLDAQVGRLVDHLKATGMWDSTVFVLTGDHGQAFLEHGFAAHGNVPFAELARAPLLIHAPGLAPGADDRPSQHVDIPPTILSILGLPSHPGFQGIDLTGARPPADRPRFVVAQTALANAYSVVSGKYTLIADVRNGFVMLYDDSLDRAQKHDLSSRLPALRDSLLHELDVWRRVQLEYYGSERDMFHWYPFNVEFDRSAPAIVQSPEKAHPSSVN